jgi:cobalt/nickel transport system permease protein
MHISEGILSAPVLVTGAALAAAGVAIGVKKMDPDTIPRVAVLSSTFFVASLIHVPIGPSSIHLILNGVNGLLLGWLCVPSIFIALTLQAILFQYGGITVLGVNTVNMALPGLICYYLFSRLVNHERRIVSLGSAFACGSLAVFLSAILLALSLVWAEESFTAAAELIVLAHLPIMAIEGLITLFCVAFLKRVKPEILGGRHENGA